MLRIIIATAILSLSPVLVKAEIGSDLQSIVKSYQSIAASCYRMGYLTKEKESFMPEEMKAKARKSCFVVGK